MIGLRCDHGGLLPLPVALAYVAIAQPFIQLAVGAAGSQTSGAHLVSRPPRLLRVATHSQCVLFLLMRLYQAMQNARVMFWLYSWKTD